MLYIYIQKHTHTHIYKEKDNWQHTININTSKMIRDYSKKIKKNWQEGVETLAWYAGIWFKSTIFTCQLLLCVLSRLCALIWNFVWIDKIIIIIENLNIHEEVGVWTSITTSNLIISITLSIELEFINTCSLIEI